jgi:hypothetical protein
MKLDIPCSPISIEKSKESELDQKHLSTFVSIKADKIAALIRKMLKNTRKNEFGDRFLTYADAIFYCYEEIAKECDGYEKRIDPEALEEFLDINHDLQDSVQSLMKLVDDIERDCGSGKPKQQIATHTYSIAKFIKELLCFVEDEKL